MYLKLWSRNPHLFASMLNIFGESKTSLLIILNYCLLLTDFFFHIVITSLLPLFVGLWEYFDTVWQCCELTSVSNTYAWHIEDEVHRFWGVTNTDRVGFQPYSYFDLWKLHCLSQQRQYALVQNNGVHEGAEFCCRERH